MLFKKKNGNTLFYNADGNLQETVNTNADNSGNGNFWSNLINNVGDWLNGTANIIDSVKGNPDNYNVTYEQKSNSGMYIGIGVAVVALVIVLVVVSNKSKAA